MQVQCMFSAGSMHVPCRFNACSMQVQCMFHAGSMHVSCRLNACMFHAYFLHTSCIIPEYMNAPAKKRLRDSVIYK